MSIAMSAAKSIALKKVLEKWPDATILSKMLKASHRPSCDEILADPWVFLRGMDDLRRLRLHNASLTKKLEESLAKNDELELKILQEESRKPLRRHSF